MSTKNIFISFTLWIFLIFSVSTALGISITGKVVEISPTEVYISEDSGVASSGSTTTIGVPSVLIEKQTFFRNAYWQCYDSFELTEGIQTSCKSSRTW